MAVSFTPTAGGAASGSLTFTDNAGGSPQSVALSGSGQDFSFAPPSGSSSSSTVTRGGTTAYTLSVGGQGGLTGTIAFTCTGAPSEASCTVSPNPVTAGSTPTNVNVSVTTTAPTLGAPRSRPAPPAAPPTLSMKGLLTLALLLAAVAWTLSQRNQRVARPRLPRMLALAAGLLLALALAACGGGGGGGGTTHDPGTPAGTYTLTVTASTGSGGSTLAHTTTLTLTVN